MIAAADTGVTIMRSPRCRIRTLMIAVAVIGWLTAVVSRSWVLALVETQLALVAFVGIGLSFKVEHLARGPLFMGIVAGGMWVVFFVLDLWLIPYMVLSH